ELAADVIGPVWIGSLAVGEPMEVQVAVEKETAIIPLLVLEPSLWVPRGKAAEPSFDEYLELLAGVRDPIPSSDGALTWAPGAGHGRSSSGSWISWRQSSNDANEDRRSHATA